MAAYLLENVIAPPKNVGPVDFLPLHWIHENIHPGTDAAEQTTYIALGIVFLYATGHVVAAISSFFLDRILVFKGYGYPYTFLVLTLPSSTVQQGSRNFYRGSIFWLNVWLFVWLILRIFYMGAALGLYSWLIIAVPFFVFLIAKLVISDVCNRKTFSGMPRCYARLRLILFRNRARVLSWTKGYALGFNAPADLVGKLINTNIALEDDVRDAYRKFFKSNFHMDPNKADSNNYWFSTFFVMQKERKLYDRISQWYQISNFARNMAAAFYLAYFYGLICVFCSSDQSVPGGKASIIFFQVGLLAVACIMVIRFYHAFVSYYSKGLYRAFVYINQTLLIEAEANKSKHQESK